MIVLYAYEEHYSSSTKSPTVTKGIGDEIASAMRPVLDSLERVAMGAHVDVARSHSVCLCLPTSRFTAWLHFEPRMMFSS